jgi:hypothetical protein
MKGLTMFVPVVTPDLAEKALPGAATHALTVRASTEPDTNAADLELFRSMHSTGDLIVSTTAYAIGLVWWFSVDRWRRGDLLDEAMEILLASVTTSETDAALAAGYEVYANQLSRTALSPVLHAAELELEPLVHGVQDIDTLTMKFADATVHSLLLAGQEIFGDPARSAEKMRNTMTLIAYSTAA